MQKIQLNYTSTNEETIESFMNFLGFSSSNIYQEINTGNVLKNAEKIRDKKIIIFPGDQIQITLNSEVNELPLNDSPISIVYEDEYILIVDKPKDIHVEPYKKNTNNNLACMVANYFFKNEIPSKVHLVNRLDRCTSGLVIIAKNRYIKNIFSKTKITKKYHAKIEGKIEGKNTIKIAIGKEPFANSRIEDENGKTAITEYETISYDEIDDFSFVDIKILTGRTHQIRLSFSSIGHPLVGDILYGSKRKADIYLRSYYLKFVHPITGKEIELVLKD
ncbi:MAG: RluA family pseudouridine synthase [Bacilli bacterium]|nr:RluA family pseudouridine synthase [Bacilli bacterium]